MCQLHVIMKKLAHLPNHIIFNTSFAHCYNSISSDTEVFIGEVIYMIKTISVLQFGF